MRTFLSFSFASCPLFLAPILLFGADFFLFGNIFNMQNLPKSLVFGEVVKSFNGAEFIVFGPIFNLILSPILTFWGIFLTCKTSPNPLFLERLSNLSMGPKLSFLAPFSTLILSPFFPFWGRFYISKK